MGFAPMDAYSTERDDIGYSDRPPVLIAGSSDRALQQARCSIEPHGARIGAMLNLSQAQDRIRLQGAASAVWIELDEDGGEAMDDLLRLVSRDALDERYAAVVSVARPLIDMVDAVVRDSPVEILIDPDEAERAAAFAIATSRLAAPLRAGDIASDRNAERLRQLSDAADPTTRTFDARFTLAGSPASAPLGSTVTVRLNVPGQTAAMSVPLGAIYDRGQGAGVWVVSGRGTVSWRPVRLAALGEETAVVAAGLQPGERFVALGAHMLHQGEPVRIDAGAVR